MPSFSKAIFLTLAFFCTLFTACRVQQKEYVEEAPMLSSINIIDRNGLTETINTPERLEQYAFVDFLQPQSYQKVLRVYMRDSEGNIPACITSYHPNGYPEKYLEILNGRACGAYKEWYPSGIKKIDARVIEGAGDIVSGSEKSWIFDGCCQVWKESGVQEATILYEKGKLEGVSTYFHTNDQVWKIIPYHENNIEGDLEIYRCDGSLLQSTHFCKGLKEGPSKRYWTPTQLAADETYNQGLLVTGTYFDSNGEPIATVQEGNGQRAIFGKETLLELQEYRYGKIDGEIKIYDVYGRVNRIYHAKNGAKYGEEICFYDAPCLQKTLIPKLSVNWVDGKIQGTSKTWYDNGTLESQKEMSNNKKNGHSSAWFRDGSLMMIEEYEQSKLVRGEYYAKGEKFPISEVIDGKGTATLFDGDGNVIQKINYANKKPLIEE